MRRRVDACGGGVRGRHFPALAMPWSRRSVSCPSIGLAKICQAYALLF